MPFQVRMRPAAEPASVARTGPWVVSTTRVSIAMRLGTSLTKPLSKELDHPLSGLVGGLAVDLADLVGEHRVRHLAETACVARARVDLDHLERVAEALLERRESVARGQAVLAEPQAHGAQALVGA